MKRLSTQETRIIEQFDNREEDYFSGYAARSREGERRYKEAFPSIRPSYARDADRILHSFAFTRYIDKTQVFYLSDNDFITHRIIHVQLVSKIGRLIARALKLNEDLVEAIALGHDIGHSPFGHEGEKYLSEEITEKLPPKKSFYLRHSVQGIRFLDELEGTIGIGNGNRSLNLTLQVLDGILCHDGENLLPSLSPIRNKTWRKFDSEVTEKKKKRVAELAPMTLEGCLVRFVDAIAYVGRDIEDAIMIGLLKRKEFPADLGSSNREIVNALAMDIIENSEDKDAISYSSRRYEQLKRLQEFNNEKIYNNPMIKKQKEKIKDMMFTLYSRLLEHVKDKKTESPIFLDHIDHIHRYGGSPDYLRKTSPETIVVDYITGMTDDYFVNVFNELFFPKRLPFNFRQIERLTGLRREELRRIMNIKERGYIA